MNKLLSIIFLLMASLSSFASVELKVGDILLQPLDCWSCSLIEEEENTIYSHAGIIVAVTPEVLVAEALGKVRTLPLETFKARTRKDARLAVMRLNHDGAVEYLQNHQTEFLKMFHEWFEGSAYDHAFLWNNMDANGVEMFYCTEFITKFLQGFLGVELPVKSMHFIHNRDQWIKFFHGNPPDGKPGNSPGDFERSDKLHEVGEL